MYAVWLLTKDVADDLIIDHLNSYILQAVLKVITNFLPSTGKFLDVHGRFSYLYLL